ncbi:lipid IV(A) 3-deoxy-D-manno-octulosonic acid transferase [Marinibactrum halimedae]|uniref:3-deoxy-D-manno-octulosonic acid transferase n=1 Tax=Marinibactrum halimedae TaxID=1444977 RepID=A0AA37WM24_9GAMM|nr:lipid IV(A) 3-deoxy-D-manno-octulosonic acid transferase [Marinibactrum halimedae]MCD9459333.1 lipid IV(A) 3-deoxy-D-manno-octulosonic acid transferase [Marinibactrum halimedae]GLS25775.1 3-deoxy-D-manno-octulosonic acid transferase [Marinibactrum halimedae]
MKSTLVKGKFIRGVYSGIFYTALPFILWRLKRRARLAPEYGKRWGERFGGISAEQKAQLVQLHQQGEKKLIWLHAVSVGETIAAAPLVNALLNNPDIAVWITSTTPTGAAQVQQRWGSQVLHSYLPYDVPLCLSRFLDVVRPNALLIMETELWPNLLSMCEYRDIPTLLINGRMSEKSARGYKKLSSLTYPMFASITAAAVQNHRDAERFYDLGLARDRTQVTGSIKFDITIDAYQEKVRQLRRALGLSLPTLDSSGSEKPLELNPQRFTFIAASTHEGEDGIILQAFLQLKRKYPQALLILVPRHPERFDEVAELIRGYDQWQLQRLSHLNELNEDEYSGRDDLKHMDVLLGDTMGELMTLYGLADVAFVGGSFVANGGHNTIEPAHWALPIVTGPSVFNFAVITEQLQSAGGLVVVDSANALAHQVDQWFSDDDTRMHVGLAAERVAKENRGALNRVIALVNQTVHIAVHISVHITTPTK